MLRKRHDQFSVQLGHPIFDCAQFAEQLRERIRTSAVEVCAAAGLEIEHVSKSHIRKEELVQRVLSGIRPVNTS